MGRRIFAIVGTQAGAGHPGYYFVSSDGAVSWTQIFPDEAPTSSGLSSTQSGTSGNPEANEIIGYNNVSADPNWFVLNESGGADPWPAADSPPAAFPGTLAPYFCPIYPAGPGLYYGGSAGGGGDTPLVWKLDGATWSDVGAPSAVAAGSSIRTVVLTNTGALVCGLDGVGAGTDGVYRSTDGGANWTQRLADTVPNNQNAALNNAFVLCGLSGSNSRMVFPFNETLLAGGLVEIWRSTNDGASWTNPSNVDFSPSAGFVSYSELLYVEGDTLLIAASFDGVAEIRRNTGLGTGSWTSVLSLTPNADDGVFCKLTSLGLGARIVAAFGRQIWTSDDQGATWTQQTDIYSGDPGDDAQTNFLSVFGVAQPTVAVGILDTPGGGDYYQTLDSGDLGVTWEQGVQVEPTRGDIIWCVTRLSTGRLLAGAESTTGNQIFYSDNGGLSWTACASQPDPAISATVWCIKEIGTSGVVLAGCGPDGNKGIVIYRSTDFGLNWTQVPSVDIADNDTGSDDYFVMDIVDLGGDVVLVGVGGQPSVSDNPWRMSDDAGVTFNILPTLITPTTDDKPVLTWQFAQVSATTVIATGKRTGADAIDEIWRGVLVAGPTMEFTRVEEIDADASNYTPFAGCVNLRSDSLLAFFPLSIADGLTPGAARVGDFYESADGGLTWTHLSAMLDIRNNGLAPGKAATCKLRLMQTDWPILGMFGNVSGADSFQFARSEDGGATWAGTFQAEGNNRVTDILEPEAASGGVSVELVPNDERVFQPRISSTAQLAICSTFVEHICLILTADWEFGRQVVPIYRNDLIFVNGSQQVLTFVNADDEVISFDATGLLLSKSDVQGVFGHYLGWSARGEASPFRIETVEMEYQSTREWDTSP